MSHVILGLFSSLFLIFGVSQADDKYPDRPNLAQYCLAIRGKCQQRCDVRFETELEKLQPFCGGVLRCCVEIPVSGEARNKTSRSTEKRTSLTTLSVNLLSPTPKNVLAPTHQPSGQGLAYVGKNVETKSNFSLDSYKRYQKYEGCGVPVLDRVRRIVGGSEAERCLLPWMVYISRDNLRDDGCAGTLVSDRHVATAAHCFDFTNNWPVLYIGEYNRRDTNSKRKFVTSSYKVTRHPNYNRFTFSYDIAILTLYMRIPTENFECLHPICLPEVRHVLKVGDTCTVAGWGSTSRTQYNPAVSSPMLMKTDIQVLNDSVCKDKFGIYFNNRSQICAGDLTGRTDSCVGDSGGPMMCSMNNRNGSSIKKRPIQFLMGVISSGSTPCAQADTPALYTDVQEVRDWIEDVMNRS